MIEHVVFFLEEPSAEDFLRGILPPLLPAGVSPHFLVFEGRNRSSSFQALYRSLSRLVTL